MQGVHGGTTLQWEHPGGLPGYGAVNTASRAAVGSGAGQHFPCDGSCESLQVLGDRVRKAGWFTAVGVWREQGQEEAGCLVLCVCSHVVDPSVGTWCSEPVLTWPSLGARETGRREKARGQDGRQEGCIFSRFDRIIVG